jgi:rhodanese-related sulfurtransferase
VKKTSSNLSVYIILALAIGLAPFYPEPHILGKLRWIWGGGVGMEAMDYFDLFYHGLPWIFLFYLLVKYIIALGRSTNNENMDIKVLIHEEEAHIIDVREAYEFASYHIEGAKNYPLSNFDDYLEEMKAFKNPIVLYCRSGNRSGIAADYLKSKGIEGAFNGGGLYQMKKIMKAA